MKKSDRELGMGQDISRRDFIQDAGLATLALSMPLGVAASGDPGSAGRYYPPTRTGLRGSHPGAFETAHELARDGRSFPVPRDLDEEYDLVVVGAGISGLAAAHYYRAKFGDNARILILENHDDFGGHAKRNEFHQGGQMRLALGGTHNLEHWKFSDTVNAMMDDLGVNPKEMLRNKEFGYGRNGRNGPALWFDADTYGQDKLLTGCSLDEPDTGRMVACIDEFPVSKTARDQLKRFYTIRTNILEGMTGEQANAYLEGTAYNDFLRQHGGLGDEAIHLFDNANHGGWGVETRSLSISECVFMFKGINTGGYQHKFADNGPVSLTFWGSISPPEDIIDLKDQLRASRAKMLALSFEDYEREVRTVIKGLLGPAGFDMKRDILAITVNRWPHGYSDDYLDLWTPEWPEGKAPHQIASKPFGNIVMANADAGANAYTHVAIDEAYRAVQELA